MGARHSETDRAPKAFICPPGRRLFSSLASFCRETGRLQENSPPRLRRGCGAQRHWGGVSRCDPAPDLALPRPVRTTPAVACGRGFPSLAKEGSLRAEFRDSGALAMDKPVLQARFSSRIMDQRTVKCLNPGHHEQWHEARSCCILPSGLRVAQVCCGNVTATLP